MIPLDFSTRGRGACGLWLLTALLGGAACGRSEPPPLREVPVFPGASLREEESAFQRDLLAIVMGPGQPVPPTRIYETSASFPAVVEFYEGATGLDSLVVRRFAVGSRMADLAAGIRAGRIQPERVGRLLFSRGVGAADSLPAEALADSLEALAGRVAEVEGAIAFATVRLAGPAVGEALVTIERPHLNPARLAVDSVTVITIAGPQVAPPSGGARPAPPGGASRP